MTWTELVFNLRVVFRALIDVVNDKRYWRAGRDLVAVIVGEDAREDLDRIRLAPLCREARLARLTLVQKFLDFPGGQANARWTAIHHAANSRAVAFAPSCNAEEMTEGIVRHGELRIGPPARGQYR